MRQAFVEAYRQEFGNTLGEIPVDDRQSAHCSHRQTRSVAALAIRCQGKARAHRRPAGDAMSISALARHTDLSSRDLLPGHRFQGPAVVEQNDTTTLIEPGMAGHGRRRWQSAGGSAMMDPVTLAVVRGALEQIGDEMDLHLIHAAISPIISETNDCANGIFHPLTGETIAQGRYGLPVFLAYMQFTVQNLIKLVEGEGGFQRRRRLDRQRSIFRRQSSTGRAARCALFR